MKSKLIVSLFVIVFAFSISNPVKAQHYVKPGESLSKIAKIHQMTLKDLISLNPHISNPNIIRPNDYIIIRSGTETAKDLTDYARSLQEVTAYSYGGNNFPYQVDCSAWVQGIYKKFGVNLPRVSKDQARTGKPVKFQELQVGDLMFFSTRKDHVITHVGINLGNDFFISNLNEDKDVEILSNFSSWSRNFFMWGTRYEL